MPNMVELLSRSIETEMSQKQKDKTIQTLKNNPDAGNAKAMQYRKMDNDLR
jgi:hypothetical protein